MLMRQWVACRGPGGDVLDWAAASVPGTWDLSWQTCFCTILKACNSMSFLDAIALGSSQFLPASRGVNWLALAGSHLIGTIGANVVTRERCRIKRPSGFNGDEITALWPQDDGQWQSAGVFGWPVQPLLSRRTT